jgi:hypothetical protein
MDQREMLEYLRNNPQIVQSLMESQDAQALMRMLQQRDDGQAMRRAEAGDTAQIAQMLKSILAAPGGAELLRRLGRNLR